MFLILQNNLQNKKFLFVTNTMENSNIEPHSQNKIVVIIQENESIFRIVKKCNKQNYKIN